jgi:hypothetical protein
MAVVKKDDERYLQNTFCHKEFNVNIAYYDDY